jgi:hypothetical protein
VKTPYVLLCLDICNDNCNTSVRVNSGYRPVKYGYEHVLTVQCGCGTDVYFFTCVSCTGDWAMCENSGVLCSCECSIIVFEN